MNATLEPGQRIGENWSERKKHLVSTIIIWVKYPDTTLDLLNYVNFSNFHRPRIVHDAFTIWKGREKETRRKGNKGQCRKEEKKNDKGVIRKRTYDFSLMTRLSSVVEYANEIY